MGVNWWSKLNGNELFCTETTIIICFYPNSIFAGSTHSPMSNSPLSFDDTSTAFAIRSDQELKQSHFLFSTMKYPWMVKAGTFFTSKALALRLPVKGLIRKTLFKQFCGGESIEDCQHTIDQLARFGVQTILDYSVEGEGNESSFDGTLEEAMRVASFAKKESNIAFCVIKFTGLGSSALMAKKQSGKSFTAEESSRYERFEERVQQLAQHTVDCGLRFMVDAEETWIQNEIDRLVLELMKKFNQERPAIYNTYQLYRHDALGNMHTHFDEVTKTGCFFGAKLVRGAYMEKERERAYQMGYPDPIQKNKEATDRDFNAGVVFALNNIEKFGLCAGTHNEHSSALLAKMIQDREIGKDHTHVHFAQLLGMSDNISFKLSEQGFNVGKYVPYGPVEKVLPYLFRRAEENTSIAGQSGREITLVKKELDRRKAARK